MPHSREAHEAKRGRVGDLVAIGVILAAVAWIGLPGIATAGLGWSDAPLHAMDGAFLLELIRARPFDNPFDWASEFYLRHPALGMLVYYPPGFAVVEAGVFGLFGVSAAAARATVLLFVAGACLMIYVIGRRMAGPAAGLVSALLLLTCPHGVLWSRDVMLEWPATFWILAAVACYLRDREAPSTRWAIATAVAVLAAFLTKQTAGFIGPVLALHAAWDRCGPAYRRRPVLWVAGLTTAGAAAGYLWFASRFAALPSVLLALEPDAWFYLRHLPEIAGWPLIVLSIIGTWKLAGSGRHGSSRLIVAMFLSWYAFSSLIAAKEPRYFFFALVPMALVAGFVAWPASRHEARATVAAARRRAVAWIVPFAAIAYQFAVAPIDASGTLPRYDGPVAVLADRPDADLVLVDGVREGQFIFDAYTHPVARHSLIPVRASKLLFARAARERYGYRQFVSGPNDIVALLDRYGIRYIVIESSYPWRHYPEADPVPRRWLRSLLSSDDRFDLLQAWPLDCPDPAWSDVDLRLYTYRDCPPRTADRITLPMPSMRRDVTLSLPPPRR